MPAKPGRPPLLAHERATAHLGVRLRPDEMARLQQAAERRGLPVSQWVRQVLLRAARRRS